MLNTIARHVAVDIRREACRTAHIRAVVVDVGTVGHGVYPEHQGFHRRRGLSLHEGGVDRFERSQVSVLRAFRSSSDDDRLLLGRNLDNCVKFAIHQGPRESRTSRKSRHEEGKEEVREHLGGRARLSITRFEQVDETKGFH